MAWTTPPTFSVGSTLQAAPLNAISGCLTALNSSLQINSITSVPLVGNAPPIDQPNFLLDINEQSQDADANGNVTFNFGAAFPNGVLTVLPTPGQGNIPGLTTTLVKPSVTLSGFTVITYYQVVSSSTYVLYLNNAATVQWIAVGF